MYNMNERGETTHGWQTFLLTNSKTCLYIFMKKHNDYNKPQNKQIKCLINRTLD